MTMKNLTVLSLGAGVQSSVVLLLSCQGILPKIDAAIFADTQWEPQAVYSHLYWLMDQAARASIPVIIGTAGNIKEDALRSVTNSEADAGERSASLPFFTKSPESTEPGMIWRECTREYKVRVVARLLRQTVLGLKKGQRVPADVQITQWIGISIDEKHRMKLSRQRWITNAYPLIGWPEQMLDRPWTRAMCLQWFADHYPGRQLPRSACIGCPLHGNDEWRDMRANRPKEWADAVSFDKCIRTRGKMRNELFLHRDCLPLDQVDLSDKADPKQDSLFNQECLGMCGV